MNTIKGKSGVIKTDTSKLDKKIFNPINYNVNTGRFEWSSEHIEIIKKYYGKARLTDIVDFLRENTDCNGLKCNTNTIGHVVKRLKSQGML